MQQNPLPPSGGAQGLLTCAVAQFAEAWQLCAMHDSPPEQVTPHAPQLPETFESTQVPPQHRPEAPEAWRQVNPSLALVHEVIAQYSLPPGTWVHAVPAPQTPASPHEAEQRPN